jgi:hypothetical protein
MLVINLKKNISEEVGLKYIVLIKKAPKKINTKERVIIDTVKE